MIIITCLNEYYFILNYQDQNYFLFYRPTTKYEAALQKVTKAGKTYNCSFQVS